MKSLFRRRSRYAAGSAVVALTAAIAGPVWAEPAPPFETLLQQISAAPAIVEADALLDAAQARVRQARVRTNPTLALDVENVFGDGPYKGAGDAETTLGLTQDLELWGRRAARVGVSQAEAGTAALRRDLAVVDSAGRLALVYAEAEAADRRFQLAEEALSITLADAKAALALVEEGREPMVRAIQAESEAASTRALLDEAQAEREAAFARLTAVAMLPAPVTLIPSTLIDQTPAAVAASGDGTPLVRVSEAERDVAERRIAFERIRARPDITASLGFRKFEAERATALTLGVSMPLPLFDRNRGNIEASQAEFRAAGARLITARQDAQADRQAAVARLLASASRVSASDSGVTGAQEAYRLSRIGFDAGRISQLELRSSRSALISARNAAIDARLARVRAEIDLARLQGRTPFGAAR